VRGAIEALIVAAASAKFSAAQYTVELRCEDISRGETASAQFSLSVNAPPRGDDYTYVDYQAASKRRMDLHGESQPDTLMTHFGYHA